MKYFTSHAGMWQGVNDQAAYAAQDDGAEGKAYAW